MRVLLSDTSVLIDLERGRLPRRCFPVVRVCGSGPAVPPGTPRGMGRAPARAGAARRRASGVRGRQRAAVQDVTSGSFGRRLVD